jgi:outer membrane protein assembly factor BamD
MLIFRSIILLLVLVGVFALGIAACSGSGSSTARKTTEELFREGMKDLENRDFKDAQEKFSTVMLQDPSSEYADDAQYYLAESYFQDGDYKLAAFNYNRLRSAFQSSPFYRLALFRSAEAYDRASPSYDRDQSDTKTAIGVYQSFLNLYRGDSLATLASERILGLKTKLAQKEFSIAEQYWKLDEFKAAMMYYERVIELYPDTEYHQRAVVGRIKALQKLNRNQEAIDAMNKYVKEDPTRSSSPQMRQLQSELGRGY